MKLSLKELETKFLEIVREMHAHAKEAGAAEERERLSTLLSGRPQAVKPMLARSTAQRVKPLATFSREQIFRSHLPADVPRTTVRRRRNGSAEKARAIVEERLSKKTGQHAKFREITGWCYPMSNATVSRALKTMIAEGKAEQLSRGHFRLVPVGAAE